MKKQAMCGIHFCQCDRGGCFLLSSICKASVLIERVLLFKGLFQNSNKKVLLRERKRHTARKRAQDDDPLPAGWTWPPPLSAGPDPPPHWLELTPPSPGVDRQTKWNYYIPVVLRTRAVNIARSFIIKIFFFQGVCSGLLGGKVSKNRT